MQLTIIKKNKLSIFTLPENVNSSYWITDFENGRRINLINIEAVENSWKIISNQEAFIVDNKDIMVPSAILHDYEFYVLKSNYKNERYYIYASPVYDKTYKELGIESTSKVKVGSDNGCEITYKLNTIPGKCYEIEKKDKYYYLNILDEKSQVYVNGKRVLSTKRIEYGDTIFTFGLKVILMKRTGKDYLLVNNPNNLLNFSATFSNVVLVKDEFVDDNTELADDSLYREDSYFYRAPHFYNTVEPLEIEIEAPPQKKEEDKTPTALTIGPMITMSMSSVVMLISTISRSGGDLTSSMTTLVMSCAMLASSLLWPLVTRAYQKLSDRNYERKRISMYKKYIDKKSGEIKTELERQRNSLIENNFSVADTQNVIRGHNVRLWQRRITDDDVLTLPVGIGDMPMKVNIKYPEEHFSLSDDTMLSMAHELGRESRILNDVPITYSFYKNVATGIVGEAIINKEFIDRLILQMMANYSYDELKIVTFTSTDNETEWDYLKILPHGWSDDRSLRFFGSSNEDYREIIYYLEKVYNERRNNQKDGNKFMPHYVIITDAIKSIDSYDFIKDIMTQNINLGFSIIMLVDKISALPNECKSFINVNREECGILSSVVNASAQRFKIDFTSIDEIYNCAKELANIPINIKTEVESTLPDMYQFLEMYQVGKIEQLNSRDRWKKSNPILSLQAPIGIGKSGELITLDLHEKYHGPHGLIAGTTGSGKSEFIITYILSLAVNYHPYEVQIILIDYKGGSLAGAFSSGKYQLPHLAGTITNLDGNELNRSLASIESEIKRRQAVFNKAREVANESTIDIYKYQKLWRENRLKDMEPVAHLFIISDEFAELKEQQPEFMEKLISAARVGRSLGIHLILATQKPGGVVDPQIWSNTRFRVCLKVQDTSDSQEVLKKPDAAYLKKTGRFYLQVGYDEVYTLGQSAWAGGQYYPNTTFKKEIDTSVNVINNIGFVTTSQDVGVDVKIESQGEELPNIVSYLSSIAKEDNIKVRKLWLDKIPERIYIDTLKDKYNFNRKPYYLDPIIGEYDDPASQNQYLLTVPFSKIGNAIIYGITGSGKEMFIQSLVYSCMTSYTPEEVNFYILDFGSETMRAFSDSPYVGDVIFSSDTDKLANFIKLINYELDRRKDLFASYGGNYQSFIEESNEKMPNIVIIVNNYEAFTETYEDMVDIISQLSREAYKYGIFFVLTASSDGSIRLRTKQNFSLLYVLQQNNDTDYSGIIGNIRGHVPAKFIGRGLFKKDNIYEFQTARITDQNLNSFMKEFCKKQRESITYQARKIPILPNVVDYNAVKNSISSSNNLIVGINKNSLNVESYNFKKNVINCISAQEIESTFNFVNALIDENAYLKQYEMIFINTTEQIIDNQNLKGRVADKDFDKVFEQLALYIDNNYQTYEENGFNEEVLNNQKKFMIFIYGVSEFISKLSSENQNRFADIIKKDSQISLVSFVLIDNADAIKDFAYEDWFKSGVDLSRGIWIGSGISDQNLFRINKLEREDREEIPPEFGYIIQTSKAARIKLLASFNPRE